ncbi:MAG: hypothetical protein ACRCY8_10095, partial [Dermatophilaceae bacterium]
MTGRPPLAVRRLLGRHPTGEQALVVAVLVVAALAWVALVAGHDGALAGAHGGDRHVSRSADGGVHVPRSADGGVHVPRSAGDGAHVPRSAGDGAQVPAVPSGRVAGRVGHHGVGEVGLAADGSSSAVVPW